MTINNLIFSGKRNCRLLRHGLFCGAILLYSLIRIAIMYPSYQMWRSVFPSYLLFVFFWTFIILSFCYTTVYFIVPKFLYRRKYFYFFLSITLVLIALYLITALQSYYQLISTFNEIAGVKISSIFNLSPLSVIRILGNPPLVCGLLLSLKSLKNWQLKRKENEMLTRANTDAELQLLKSQIHPHFLFNTLNNIYSYSLDKPAEAAELVRKLKSTVHYMIDECNHVSVPLNNELDMIANYIELEKIRYGNRLSMQIELMDNDKNYVIAPLLLIPFVENSFKHGLSQMLKRPWITLKIDVQDGVLHFLLRNSKPSFLTPESGRKGIGLNNVKKRLELMYPGRHSLNIISTEDEFCIEMQIAMTEHLPYDGILQKKKPLIPEENLTYDFR
jgi:sensor histidine kinase YesM